MKTDKIILGIDPGTNIMGYGIIAVLGKNPEFKDMGVLKFSKSDHHYKKLNEIFKCVLQLIDNFKPDELAIEAPFYGNNVQSMLKLGRAQGVAIAAAISRSVPVFEYAPRKIKQSITGQGNASKEQVAGLLRKILDIKEIPSDLDATDGLAAALCHFYQANTITVKGGYKNWNDFIRKNPDKVV